MQSTKGSTEPKSGHSTLAVHTAKAINGSDIAYTAIVRNGERTLIEANSPGVSQFNEWARQYHEFELQGHKGTVPLPYYIMGKSAGLRDGQIPRFYSSMIAKERKAIPDIINELLRELPEERIVSLKDMRSDTSIQPKEGVVSDIMRKEDKTVLASGSKAYKTWNLINVTVGVASGTDWLGFPCKKGRVLIVNFELHKYDLRERILNVAKSKGVYDSDFDERIHTWNLRGRDNEVERLVNDLISRVRSEQYDMIIFDPTYKMLGDRRENDAGEMTELVNKLEEAAMRLKVAVVFAVHFPKGDMSKRQAIDRMSGSGVFARDPDTIMIMSDLDKKERERISGIKPEDNKGDDLTLSGNQKSIFKILKDNGAMNHSDWQKLSEGSGIGKDSFRTAREALTKKEIVAKDDDTGVYSITEKGQTAKTGFKVQAKAVKIAHSLIGAQKIEFTLRNRKPLESIVVKFNHDKSIHERLDVSGSVLDELDAEKDSKPATDPNEGKSALRFSVGPGGVTARCEEWGYSQTYNVEGKDTPPGETVKALFNHFNQECKCGRRHYNPDAETAE